MEYEPAYVDVILRRWQAYQKADAALDGDGRRFDEVAAESLSKTSVPTARPSHNSMTLEIERGDKTRFEAAFNEGEGSK